MTDLKLQTELDRIDHEGFWAAGASVDAAAYMEVLKEGQKRWSDEHTAAFWKGHAAGVKVFEERKRIKKAGRL